MYLLSHYYMANPNIKWDSLEPDVVAYQKTRGTTYELDFGVCVIAQKASVIWFCFMLS